MTRDASHTDCTALANTPDDESGTVSVETQVDYPAQEFVCECGGPAVVRGLFVVNNRVYPNTPLCADCFVPADELALPDTVDSAHLDEIHTDSLITTPADEVFQDGKTTIIRHGPGNVSRVRLADTIL